jgi:hypothetical protein
MTATSGGAPALPETPAPNPARLAEEGSGLIGFAFGALFLGLLLVNQDEPEDRGTRILAGLALGSTTLLPAILALLARKRPTLYLAAGVLGIPLAFISMAGVTLPLLLPAGMALVAYGRRSGQGPPSRVAAPLIALIALFFGIASFVSLLIHDDPRSSATENGSTYSSDVVTSSEALISLGLATTGLACSWILSKPRPLELSDPYR